MLTDLLEGLTKAQKHELDKLGVPASRRSEWKAGKRNPTLAQLMVLAMVTHIDPKPLIAWLAEQEATPAQRELFREHKIGRFGLIFTVILSVMFSMPERAFSSVGIANNVEPSRLDRLHIVNLLKHLAGAAQRHAQTLLRGVLQTASQSIQPAC